MKTAGLSRALLLGVCVACTHARTAANPRQEERAAQKAEGEGDAKDGSGSTEDEKSGESAGQSEKHGSTGDERAQPGRTGDGPAAREEGAPKGDSDGKNAARKGEEKGEEKDADDVAPEDIEVATSPQGLLEPGALDKVRDKLGVAKGESVQGPLRRFQREHDLPATGMLDHETVERLGLSPDEIFERKAGAR